MGLLYMKGGVGGWGKGGRRGCRRGGEERWGWWGGARKRGRDHIFLEG